MTTRPKVAWAGWTQTEDKQLLSNFSAGVDFNTGINATRTECMGRHVYLMRQTDEDYNRRPISWAKRV